MIIRNFLKAEHKLESSHEGEGLVKNIFLYGDRDFDTNLSFIIYTELEPGSSIGYHKHGNNEEVYVILEGQGYMIINDKKAKVEKGDVVLNKPEWSHSLTNDSTEVMKILVFEVKA